MACVYVCGTFSWLLINAEGFVNYGQSHPSAGGPGLCKKDSWMWAYEQTSKQCLSLIPASAPEYLPWPPSRMDCDRDV